MDQGLLQDLINELLEDCWGIHEPERHDEVLIIGNCESNFHKFNFSLCITWIKLYVLRRSSLVKMEVLCSDSKAESTKDPLYWSLTVNSLNYNSINVLFSIQFYLHCTLNNRHFHKAVLQNIYIPDISHLVVQWLRIPQSYNHGPGLISGQVSQYGG